MQKAKEDKKYPDVVIQAEIDYESVNLDQEQSTLSANVYDNSDSSNSDSGGEAFDYEVDHQGNPIRQKDIVPTTILIFDDMKFRLGKPDPAHDEAIKVKDTYLNSQRFMKILKPIPEHERRQIQ